MSAGTTGSSWATSPRHPASCARPAEGYGGQEGGQYRALLRAAEGNKRWTPFGWYDQAQPSTNNNRRLTTKRRQRPTIDVTAKRRPLNRASRLSLTRNKRRGNLVPHGNPCTERVLRRIPEIGCLARGGGGKSWSDQQARNHDSIAEQSDFPNSKHSPERVLGLVSKCCPVFCVLLQIALLNQC